MSEAIALRSQARSAEDRKRPARRDMVGMAVGARLKCPLSEANLYGL